MTKAKKFAPLAALTLSLLILAACKLTTNGGSLPSGPTGTTAEYLFATSNNTVWSFTVDPTTGALGAATGVSGPALGEGIAANPAGTYLYVSDSVNDEIDAYSIGSSGVLTQLANSPFAVGTVPSQNSTVAAAGLAIDSTGSHLYAADYLNNAIAGFSITSSSGALSSLGTPVVNAGGPAYLVIDPTNSYLYASDYASGAVGGVSAYTLTGSTGALTPVPGFSPFTTVGNGDPFGLATTGSFLYVGEKNANSVAQLSIVNGTGGLTQIAAAIGAGNSPLGMAVTPNGHYLYVANGGDSTISGYSVNSSTGALTALNSSPFAATSSVGYLAVDTSGAFLYASNPGDGTITGFTINSSTGALVQFTGAATSLGTNPQTLTVATVPQ